MAAANFERALALVLVHEGGYVDHPADPGGATNLGITIGTLSGWLGRPATKAEVRALTKTTVAPIYRKNYWDAIRGDELPAGVDFCVFDFAVNSGRARAVMSLQRAVGVADDGKLGPITLKAIAAKPAAQTVERICADRLAFLKRLSTWRTFGKGWNARVNGVLTQSLALAKGGAAEPPAPMAKKAKAPARRRA
ncbi:glycoside hydrolase family 108 protein [Methylobacterium sp. NMS14P]|uniref:glycoside hydrolase family 108 protein n=1 Tax=Methylobacterium sp. NMS14P TaxID=2894310 RepID=UPI0023597F74|nr:glycoside hydrolase family 108 protein [Methylobacterium sp. NMS14P]WCS27212.1 glycoside hydrolase family 108 protein [Methylobacterium sp. NMS14P]